MSLHRIKIIQSGWETFTGEFAGMVFVNGETEEPATQVTTDRIAAELDVIDADTGLPLGPQHRLLASQCVTLEAVEALERASEQPEEPKVPVTGDEDPATENESEAEETGENAIVTEPEIWTEEKLAAVADDKGIKGLREIADPMGVRGRAIPELITEILAAQKAKLEEAANRLPREG